MAGGMCGGGACGGGGACVAGEHACHTCPPTPRDTVGQCAGGTHPTGMHSCLFVQGTHRLPSVKKKHD